MKVLLEAKNILSMVVIVFLLSIITLFGIMQFRFFTGILDSYENDMQQVVVNKTTFFLNDLTAISENAAKRIVSQEQETRSILKLISTYDYRIVNVYLLDAKGNLHDALVNKPEDSENISWLGRPTQLSVSPVHVDQATHLNIVSFGRPLHYKDGSQGWLVLDFSIDQFQKEIMQEFAGENFKVALFDNQGHPIIWPFDQTKLADFRSQPTKFYDHQSQFDVRKNEVGTAKWQLYFFLKETHFETFRAIAVIILVFVLYICLYQLLVEFWGVNSAKTYFENIDFAIFNQINEGVILSNNAGRIIFANKAAQEIFVERKNSLRNVKLKEILGHIDENQHLIDKSKTFTLKVSDRLLEAIHSPIIKQRKKLGSLTVIRPNVKEEKTYRNVLSRLVETIPEGVVYVDKNFEVVAANLMAKLYLGNIETGTNIYSVDPGLAAEINNHIGSRSVIRTGLSNYDLPCEIAPVYDDDGVYAGTLVVLLTALHDNNPACPS